MTMTISRGAEKPLRTTMFAGILVLALTGAGAAAGKSVLFVGNSFLFGSGSAVRFYRADTVTDLNHEGIGGVPPKATEKPAVARRCVAALSR